MAGIVKKALVGAAGIIALASAYYVGKWAGQPEPEPTAGPTPDAAPRPGLRGTEDQVRQVCRDPKAYHESINGVSQNLRERVAGQVLETAAVQAAAGGAVIEQAASDAASCADDSSEEASEGQDDDPAPGAAPVDDADKAPYEKIQEALSTTELFTETNEKAYKPEPFKMPGKTA